MPYSIQTVRKETYLHLHVAGETTVASLKQMADVVKAEAAKARLSHVVLDCQRVTGQVSLSSLFLVGDYYARTLADEVQLAIINSPPNWSHNDFSEDVIYLRGGVMRHFNSLDEVEAWFATTPSKLE